MSREGAQQSSTAAVSGSDRTSAASGDGAYVRNGQQLRPRLQRLSGRPGLSGRSHSPQPSGKTAQLTPQAKLLAAVIAVVGIVLSAPHTLFTVASVLALVLALAYIGKVRIRRVLARSLLVVPVAGMISLFYPLRFVAGSNQMGIVEAYTVHWPEMLQLIATPWLCVLVMMLLAQLTPQAELLAALERLHLPRLLVTMLSFLYRYVDVMRFQLRAAHRALESRAPGMSARRRVLLYGNLAGSMLVRAYDRGERIHAAMLSRGFTGTLPRLHTAAMRPPDYALIAAAVLFAAALVMLGW